MARNFLVDRIGVSDVPLKVDFFSLNLHFHSCLSFKFSAGYAFINALSQGCVLGWGSFSFPGKYKTPTSCLQLRKSVASTSIPLILLRASTMSPVKCWLSDRRIRSLRQVRRRCSTTRIAAVDFKG